MTTLRAGFYALTLSLTGSLIGMGPVHAQDAVKSTPLPSTTEHAPATTTQSGKADVLVKSTSSWNGKEYGQYPTGTPELTVLRLVIAPHTALPWHTHPYPNAVFVQKGVLIITDKATGEHKTFHAGEAFTESVNDVHHGASGEGETVLIITYAGIKGQPTSAPVPGGDKEY